MIRRACFPISSTIEAQAGFLEKGKAGQMVVPVRYGLLEHEVLGPVLIDTGYTPRLLAQKGWKMALYRMALDPQFHPHLLPQTMLNNWGYRLEDVQHVVVTHLHADHVCGLDLFPEATIHLSQVCMDSWKATAHWSDARHGLFRSLLPAAGDRLKPMETAVRQRPLGFGDSPGWDVLGDGSVWMVSLEGHMAGHAGVAFQCQERQVLYAADVAWTRHGYRQKSLPPAPLRWAIENTTQATAAAQAVLTAERLGWDVLLCHDPETTRWDCQP